MTIEDDAGKQTRHRIVGPDEFDRAEGYISMDAPLARALMRKGLDDEVKVPLPGGERGYVVVGISLRGRAGLRLRRAVARRE